MGGPQSIMKCREVGDNEHAKIWTRDEVSAFRFGRPMYPSEPWIAEHDEDRDIDPGVECVVERNGVARRDNASRGTAGY